MAVVARKYFFLKKINNNLSNLFMQRCKDFELDNIQCELLYCLFNVPGFCRLILLFLSHFVIIVVLISRDLILSCDISYSNITIVITVVIIINRNDKIISSITTIIIIIILAVLTCEISKDCFQWWLMVNLLWIYCELMWVDGLRKFDFIWF